MNQTELAHKIAAIFDAAKVNPVAATLIRNAFPKPPEPKDGEWWKVKHFAGHTAVRIYRDGTWYYDDGYNTSGSDWEPICKMQEVPE